MASAEALSGSALGATNATIEHPGPILFDDDRSVKMLYASAHHNWGAPGSAVDPRIYLEARTRVDALADMELANRLERHGGPKLGWEDDPEDDYETVTESLRTADWLDDRGDRLSRHTAELLRRRVAQHHQERLLQGNDAFWARRSSQTPGDCSRAEIRKPDVTAAWSPSQE